MEVIKYPMQMVSAVTLPTIQQLCYGSISLINDDRTRSRMSGAMVERT